MLNGYFQYTRENGLQASGDCQNNKDGLYDHLQNLPYDEHVKAETGDLIQRCTSDVETLRRFLAMQLVEMGRAIVLLAVSLVFMFNLNIKMTWVSMIVVPFIFLFSFIFFTKVKEAFQEADEAEGKLSTILQENLTGVQWLEPLDDRLTKPINLMSRM